jgi:hypothetical protein
MLDIHIAEKFLVTKLGDSVLGDRHLQMLFPRYGARVDVYFHAHVEETRKA